MTRRIHVIGIGAGDPDYVTAEAVRGTQRHRRCSSRWTRGKRRTIWWRCVGRSASGSSSEPGYRFVELADPQRAKDADYRQAVARWHSARAAVWADAIERELAPDGVGAFLAWGDPSLYDSTLRILDMVAQRVDIYYDVIPGITAIQALTARHRIPLNDIGEPVLITTGRRLAADGLAGSAVVMLDGDCAFRSCPPETRIWWGAYLGTPDELLVSGTVGEVGEKIAELRAEARATPRLDHGHVSAAAQS